MRERKTKTVLFLCTGTCCHGRLAEALFNSVAGKMGLPWSASARALAPQPGVGTAGPPAAAAVEALEPLGGRATDAFARPPGRVTTEDLERADRVVALNRAEHLPLLEERFPGWAERVECWHVADTPEAPGPIEREVMGLVARILGGGQRPDGPPAVAIESGHAEPKVPAGKAVTLKVGRETAGRRGKGVTTVFDLPLDAEGVRDLAARLKQRCGTGGTVKDGRIEIQGDQRERIAAELERLGYRVKRVGG